MSSQLIRDLSPELSPEIHTVQSPARLAAPQLAEKAPAALSLKPTPMAMAKAAGLRYVSDTQPGYTRRRRGRGFTYYDWKGNIVNDAKLRDRFNQLVIPPAWQEVWICRQENGHILAVGRDEARRKQYIYHPAWAQVRDQVKYSKLLHFGEALPDLRQQAAADLRQRKL